MARVNGVEVWLTLPSPRKKDRRIYLLTWEPGGWTVKYLGAERDVPPRGGKELASFLFSTEHIAPAPPSANAAVRQQAQQRFENLTKQLGDTIHAKDSDDDILNAAQALEDFLSAANRRRARL